MAILSISTIDGWYISVYVLGIEHADNLMTFFFIFTLLLLVDFLALGLLIAIILDRF